MAEDEDENREELRKEVRLNYEIHKEHLPEDFKSTLETFFELHDFHFNVSKALEDECLPALEKLAREHYPGFADKLHPILSDYITTTHQATCFGIAYQMKGLVQSMHKGIDIKKEYPKLEEWRAFYLNPQPSTLDDKLRNRYLWPDDKEWEKEKERENREMLRFFLWQQKRQQEFYDIIQPVLFRLYPVLETLEGDFWVLYAVNLRDNYEEWLTMMEHIEYILELGMPAESVNWENEKFRKESYARYTEQKRWLKLDDTPRAKLIEAFKLPDEYSLNTAQR